MALETQIPITLKTMFQNRNGLMKHLQQHKERNSQIKPFLNTLVRTSGSTEGEKLIIGFRFCLRIFLALGLMIY